MRRGLASLIMGLSLLVATVSWAGFTLSRTLLDPGRSERLADQLLDNEQVRDALVSRLADALEAQVPAEVPVSRQLIESGAEVALDDPRVEALVRDGFVQVHQNALAGESEPVVVDAGALGAAGRDALVGVRPELDLLLPAAPSLGLELPATGLSWLGSVKNFVDRWTLVGAVASAAGLIIAFVVARDRAPVLRRVAFWAFGVAAFWLGMGYALPWLIGLVSPTSAALATAMVDVFFGAMIAPAVTMAAVGVALLIASLLWPMFSGRRGAAKLQPRTARPDGRTGLPGPARPVGPTVAPAGPSAAGRYTAPPASPPRATGPMIDLSRPRPAVAPAGRPATAPTPAGHGVGSGVGHPGPTARPGAPAPAVRDSTAVMPGPYGPTPTGTAPGRPHGQPTQAQPPQGQPVQGQPVQAQPTRVQPPQGQTPHRGATTARMPEPDSTTVWEAGRGYLDETETERSLDEQATTRWDDIDR